MSWLSFLFKVKLLTKWRKWSGKFVSRSQKSQGLFFQIFCRNPMYISYTLIITVCEYYYKYNTRWYDTSVPMRRISNTLHRPGLLSPEIWWKLKSLCLLSSWNKKISFKTWTHIIITLQSEHPKHIDMNISNRLRCLEGEKIQLTF